MGEEYVPSRYEELIEKGEAAIDPDDWCADAQKAVVSGADGMWFRLGPKPDGQKFRTLLCSCHLNPCTSVMACIFLFGLVIFCAAWTPSESCFIRDPVMETINGVETAVVPAQFKLKTAKCYVPGTEFGHWQTWVTSNFTWLYIGTQDVWIVFAAVVYFSKYGAMTLGKDGEKAEFGDFSFFAMVFTCGVATGLFFFAASEPIYHYEPFYFAPQRWAYAGVIVDSNFKVADVKQADDSTVPAAVLNLANRRAQEAMNMVWYHWGLHGWVCYAIMGVLLAFLHFRKGLPMTIKSCFYPLIGKRAYGFLGDVLDAISMCATTMGVCTSLGLGVMQLDAGIERLNGGKHWLGEPYYSKYNFDTWKGDLSDYKEIWDGWPESIKLSKTWDDTGNDSTGTAAGIANTFARVTQQSVLIWLITALATTSVMCGLKYGIKTLALICFGLGCFLMFYVWAMDDTWFITNLFVQSTGHYIQYLPSLGFYTGAFEQMGNRADSNMHGKGELASYMNGWTIFYWGWWIAWAPFVGVFLARIARGRTIRQFILWTILLPSVYNLLFMTIIGGAALKMQMTAEKFGIGVPSCNDPARYGTPAWNDEAHFNYHKYQKNICRSVTTGYGRYTTENEYFCSSVTNLMCTIKQYGATDPIYDILEQYEDAGKFLCVICMIALILYFVASSDSGSMVDDMISANGLPEPPLPQRFFWAMTEGLAATVLLGAGIYTGKADGGLKALRAISICVGLPYTFLICFMCVALWRALQYEAKDRKWTGNYFESEIVDFGFQLYQAREGQNLMFNAAPGKCDFNKMLWTFLFVWCPPLAMWPACHNLENKRGKGGSPMMAKALTISAAFCFYLFLLLSLIDYAPVNTSPWEKGAVVGNETSPDGNTIHYTSRRYGYFREFAMDVEENAVIKHHDIVSSKANEVDATFGSAPVAGRVGRNQRIETIGWFFFFIFVVELAFVRNMIRLCYKIPGNLIEDFLASTFAYPAVLYQCQDQCQKEPPKDDESNREHLE